MNVLQYAVARGESKTMPVQIDYDNLPLFPKRIPEKLRSIREHLGLTPLEIAAKVLTSH
jgi:hypothetical protein